MPSVADLGRHLAAQWSAYDLFDQAEGSKEASPHTMRKATIGKANAWANILALGDLIMAQPVETPADALVVALQGYCVADIELGSADTPELRQMRRAFAGIACALADAGAGDLRCLAAGYSVDLLRLCAGVEGAQ
jgi:predicted deacylase